MENINNDEKTWMNIINPFLKSDAMQDLKSKLKSERNKYIILPPGDKTFEAFKLCPYEKTRVVIIGQDPYPDRKHAHGLGFSSLSEERPASLQNLFIEAYRNLYYKQEFDDCFKSNNLLCWAEQGVLLINSCLTVREGEPGSHNDIGWEEFMKFILNKIDNHPNNPIIVFMGKKAQSLYKYISPYPKTYSMFVGHPSPLNARKYFIGCGMFQYIQDELIRRYFQNLNPMLGNEDVLKTLTVTLKSFTDKMGLNIKINNIEANTKMYLEGLAPYVLEAYPEITKNYIINWRT
jgi:uracil-DNA glycosylase